MLTIDNLTHRIEARALFENASAQISAGWKVGLVGRNGTGKSTLLHLIQEEAGKDRRDSIRMASAARLGWVAQEVPASDTSILDLVLEADRERAALLREAETAEDPDRIADIHTRLSDIDAWSAEARAASVLTGLGFSNEDLARPSREFSGGWRMRAALAGVLFTAPDLLLLDEPTNYLDLEGAAWLERYLKAYPNTVILVSHDRDMLNRCVTHIMALENKRLSITPGGYEDWLQLKAAKVSQLEAMRAKQDAERAHLQSFVDRFRAKATKARQAQSRLKRLERMQDIPIPVADRTIPFTFDAPDDPLPPPMLRLENAVLGYGEDAVILNGVDVRVDPDDRWGVIGTNGQGKTTLVKSIAGRLALMSGTRLAGKQLRVGYFSQDQMDELTAERSVLDHVRDALLDGTPPNRVRSVAAQIGFSEEKVGTATADLSGGEKVRLLLGLIALERPHLLILDEPTSHLDIDSREALIHALNDFAGAVLLITHDVFLLEATVDRLWLVKDGELSRFEGDLDEYRRLVLDAERNATRKTVEPKQTSEETGDPKSKADHRRERANAKKAAAPLKRRAETLEKNIAKLMKTLEDIDTSLASPDLDGQRSADLMKRRARISEDLETAEAEWLAAAEAYEAATVDA